MFARRKTKTHKITQSRFVKKSRLYRMLVEPIYTQAGGWLLTSESCDVTHAMTGAHLQARRMRRRRTREAPQIWMRPMTRKAMSMSPVTCRIMAENKNT